MIRKWAIMVSSLAGGFIMLSLCCAFLWHEQFFKRLSVLLYVALFLSKKHGGTSFILCLLFNFHWFGNVQVSFTICWLLDWKMPLGIRFIIFRCTDPLRQSEGTICLPKSCFKWESSSNLHSVLQFIQMVAQCHVSSLYLCMYLFRLHHSPFKKTQIKPLKIILKKLKNNRLERINNGRKRKI